MTKRLDDLIDEMFVVREDQKALLAAAKEKGKQLAAMQARFAELAKAAGTDYARGTLASASITTQTVPHAEDWDAIHEWIIDNDAMYLLHRRIAAAAWKELRDAGTDVPGINPYEAESVSLRKLGD